MGNIVELSYNAMIMVWTEEPILILYLGTEMAEDDYGRLVGSNKERSY